MSNNKVFWGILTAAAAGAIIGLLFAPEDGEETRKKIRRSANDWASDMLDQIEKGKVKAQDVGSKIKTNSEHLKDEFVGAVEGTIESAKSAMHRAKPEQNS